MTPGFDVVLSSTAIHNIPEADERVSRSARAIFDIMRGDEHVDVPRQAGVEQFYASRKTWLWLVPGRIITARKKA